MKVSNLQGGAILLAATFIEKSFWTWTDCEKVTRRLEIDLVSCIRKHDKNAKFQKLGERLEDLKERHEQGLITSVEF